MKVGGRSVLKATFRGETLVYDTPTPFEFRVVDRIFVTGGRASLDALASARVAAFERAVTCHRPATPRLASRSCIGAGSARRYDAKNRGA